MAYNLHFHTETFYTHRKDNFMDDSVLKDILSSLMWKGKVEEKFYIM